MFFQTTFKIFFSKIEILPDLSIDHSLVTLTMSKSQSFAKGSTFWKFNSSFIYGEIYVSKMKDSIQEFKTKNIFNDNIQLDWDFFKNEIQHFTINYCQNIAKKYKKE